MVTPVHRFQSVEAVVGRSHHSHHRYHNPRHASVASVASGHHHHQHHQQQRVVASTAEIDGFLDPANNYMAFQPGAGGPALAAAGRLKCGMWASFVLVTVFMAGAKFYFNTQSTGLEVLVFCALLVVVLLAGCAVSVCEAVTQPTPPQAAVVTAAPTVITFPTFSPTSPPATSSNNTSAPGHSTSMNSASTTAGAAAAEREQLPAGHIAPPPPYHIAVLLPPPPPQGPPSPPPAYDKAVCVS